MKPTQKSVITHMTTDLEPANLFFKEVDAFVQKPQTRLRVWGFRKISHSQSLSFAVGKAPGESANVPGG
jgi:hypothetical protein